MISKLFRYDDTTDPNNVLVTITWTSEVDTTYALYTSTDFNEPTRFRRDINDAIPGEEGTTSFTVNFNDELLPIGEAKRFFVVLENEG